MALEWLVETATTVDALISVLLIANLLWALPLRRRDLQTRRILRSLALAGLIFVAATALGALLSARGQPLWALLALAVPWGLVAAVAVVAAARARWN